MNPMYEAIAQGQPAGPQSLDLRQSRLGISPNPLFTRFRVAASTCSLRAWPNKSCPSVSHDGSTRGPPLYSITSGVVRRSDSPVV